MSRDGKAPLIQDIAQTAFSTFKGFRASSGASSGGGGHVAAELRALVTAVRAADLNIAPRNPPRSSGAAALERPPVTYMHICETEVFSMGVFLMTSGASMPLHDHPGMNGMLKVLYGKVRISSYDQLEENLSTPPQFKPPLAPPQTSFLRRSVLRSVAEYSEHCGPCLLTPVQDNFHQIAAVEGPAAFLDILAPPYDPDDGRDCHYYRVLQIAAEEGGAGGKSIKEHQGEKKEKTAVTWLLEVPQPEDFWCGGEPYPGPAVSF
ncbi:2-aminoethanethiol dioxygenase-like [Brachionichthys hirsutus]|uniref:2-aminoethanethiol dioxygenase-like n=1 Tax=Brachionichthys hirsutus TaxID=412623 RepID=UPI003604E25F